MLSLIRSFGAEAISTQKATAHRAEKVEPMAAVPSAGQSGEDSTEPTGGLDKVRRAAEARIEQARQMMWGESSLAEPTSEESSSEYKTAFSAYFDDDTGR